VEVDWAAGLVRNLTQNTEMAFETLPRGDLEMLEAGGLENYLKKRLLTEGKKETTP